MAFCSDKAVSKLQYNTSGWIWRRGSSLLQVLLSEGNAFTEHQFVNDRFRGVEICLTYPCELHFAVFCSKLVVSTKWLDQVPRRLQIDSRIYTMRVYKGKVPLEHPLQNISKDHVISHSVVEISRGMAFLLAYDWSFCSNGPIPLPTLKYGSPQGRDLQIFEMTRLHGIDIAEGISPVDESSNSIQLANAKLQKC